MTAIDRPGPIVSSDATEYANGWARKEGGGARPLFLRRCHGNPLLEAAYEGGARTHAHAPLGRVVFSGLRLPIRRPRADRRADPTVGSTSG